jgi:hypothetical protein
VEGSGRSLIFKVLSQYLPGGLLKTTKNISHDFRCPGRDLKPGPPEHEAGVSVNHSTTTFGGIPTDHDKTNVMKL